MVWISSRGTLDPTACQILRTGSITVAGCLTVRTFNTNEENSVWGV
jgi:hypothetical protein